MFTISSLCEILTEILVCVCVVIGVHRDVLDGVLGQDGLPILQGVAVGGRDEDQETPGGQHLLQAELGLISDWASTPSYSLD